MMARDSNYMSEKMKRGRENRVVSKENDDFCGYVLDKNGKISDADSIYYLLDLWENDKIYDKVLDAVEAVPPNLRSAHLCFYAVRALFEKGEYKEMQSELDNLSILCISPRDRAMFEYFTGLIYLMQGKEARAWYCFQRVSEEDIDNEADIDLAKMRGICRTAIFRGFSNLEEIVQNISYRASQCCDKIPEEGRIEVDENDFAMLLSFVPSIRSVAGLKYPLGLNGLFSKYESEDDIKTVKDWLLRAYKIQDLTTLEVALRREFHVGSRYQNFVSYKKGGLIYAPEDTNEDGRNARDLCLHFFEVIAPWIPKGGLCAWDISEKLGLARQTYACGLIDPDELIGIAMSLADEAKSCYNSWRDYFMGLFLGGGFFMFFISDFNIKKSCKFINRMSELVFESNIADTLWNSDDIKELKSDTFAYERWIRVSNISVGQAAEKIKAYRGHDEKDDGMNFRFFVIEDRSSVFVLVPVELDFYDFLRLAYSFGNGTLVFGIHSFMDSWDFVSIVSNAVGINGMQYMSRGAHKLLHSIKETDKSNMTIMFRNNYISEIIFINEFYNELQLKFAPKSEYQKKFNSIISEIDIRYLRAVLHQHGAHEVTVQIS